MWFNLRPRLDLAIGNGSVVLTGAERSSLQGSSSQACLAGIVVALVLSLVLAVALTVALITLALTVALITLGLSVALTLALTVALSVALSLALSVALSLAVALSALALSLTALPVLPLAEPALSPRDCVRRSDLVKCGSLRNQGNTHKGRQGVLDQHHCEN